MSKKTNIKNIQDIYLSVLNVLPKNDQYNAIRSNLIKRYEPLAFCEKNGICKTCGRYYSQIPRKFEIVPNKKSNRFIRRLHRKSSNNNEVLGTPYQMDYLKKLKNLINVQTIRTTCQFCNYTIDKKKDKWIRPKARPESKIVEVKKKVKKSKKAKKGKEFAGLNKNAVLSVKRKIETTNPEEEITAKKKKLDQSVILLDTQVNSSVKENSTNVIINEKNIVETVDNSIIYIDKTPCKNSTLKQPEVINLVTPSTSVINLVTPVTKQKNQNTSLKSLPSKKKRGNANKEKKQANKILASDKKTPGKANKKLNSLQNFWSNDNEINKTISNLEQFLQSIS